MLEVIKTLLFVSVQVLGNMYINIKLSNRKVDLKSIKNLIILLIMTLLTFILWKYANNIYKPLLLFGLWIMGYKYILNMNFNESMVINFICSLLNALSELIIVGVIVVILKIPEAIITQYITGNPLFALLSFGIVVLFTIILKKPILKLKEILKKDKILYTFYIISIFGLSIFLYENIKNFSNSKAVSLNTITMLLFCFFIVLLFREKFKTNKIQKEYDTMFDYLENTETLLEKYQKYNHENKNQLIVLKSMAPKNKKIVEFIDNILEDEIDHKDKWISQLKNIPNGGLKGLLSYKINQMTDNKIKVTVNTSSRVKNFKFNKLGTKAYRDICKIIGVYLDNAYEASKESRKKEVTIEMLIEKELLVIIISNTYKGKIKLSEIDKSGYTTKGKGHGVGLSLVKDIIESSKNLSQKRDVINDYYFQYFYIKNPKTNKIHKV